jgi:acyl-CoA reductase-like NAD-dependent aldehyde dehydrogenase
MLKEFNEGRSKSYYCIAATVLEIEDLEKLLPEARKQASELTPKEKARILHAILDRVPDRKKCYLKLRK